MPDDHETTSTLNEWFRSSGHSAASLAAALNCDVSTINELLRGRRWPSLTMAVKLHHLTHGVVCRWDALFHEQNQRIPASRVAAGKRAA